VSVLRILLVGDYPPDARLGSTKVLLKLQEEFRSLGHACDVLLADRLHAPDNPYLRQGLAPIAALSAVRRVANERGAYDVIDVASAEGLWIALRRTGVLSGAVVVARSNGLEHLNYRRMLDDHRAGLLHKPWSKRIFHPLVRLTQVTAAARAADRLILLNEIDRAYAIDRGWKAPSEIDVVAHGVSTRFLTDAPTGAEPRGQGILFCGTWTDVKGVSYLAQAFSKMAARGARTRLTILGGGRPESVIRAAFGPDAQPLLAIRERVSEEAVMAAYRTHDVLAWPSTYEGFGMTVIEAMSQRLPVVATPVGCAASLVASEQSGLLVPSRNPDRLAAALTRMVRDVTLRRRCADGAAKRVSTMSWTATATRTLDVYDRARAARRLGTGPVRPRSAEAVRAVDAARGSV